MAVIKKDGGFMALPINIKRGNPIPLDSTSIWYDYAALEEYAKTGATAYVGQIVTYVNEADNKSTVYVISNAEGDLLEVGSGAGGSAAVDVDNNTVVLNDKGALTLKDFGKKYYRYVPVDEEAGTSATYVVQIVDEEHPWKSGLMPQVVVDPEDGDNFIIGWYEPNPTTLEGINTAISGLQDEVANVKSNLTNNYYTKGEIDAKTAGAMHYKGIVGSKADLASVEDAAAGDIYIAKDTSLEYIYDGENWEELGNQLDLSKFETRIGKLEDVQIDHKTKIEKLETIIDNLQTVSGTYATQDQVLEISAKVGSLEEVLGQPASDDQEASGIFAQLATIDNRFNQLDYVSGATINGTDVPESEGKIQLFDFTQSNGLAGLVPVPGKDILSSDNTYVLSANGDWVQPFDTRIGTLQYNDVTYTKVEDYIDARVSDVTISWSKITD